MKRTVYLMQYMPGIIAVQSQAGIEIERRRLHLEEPIRALGAHEVPLRLHPEVEVRLNVEVVAE